MSDPNKQPSSQTSPQPNSIGDQNVERLLATAYDPETLDAEFVKRVHMTAAQAAKDRHSPTQSREKQRIWSQPVAWFAAGGVAIASILLIANLIGRKTPETDPYYVDGDLVWIAGKPYAPTSSASKDRSPEVAGGPRVPGARPPHGPLTPVKHDAAADEKTFFVGHRGLTPRPRPESPPVVEATVGAVLATQRGERRRVELPDHSVLYLNEDSKVKVEANRRITVETGEVFVEVSPAESNNGAKFVVATPDRNVTALGTKFVVKVNPQGTDVGVTHGKVKINGVDSELLAGQQIRAMDISPLPRTSHVLRWTRDLMSAAESPLVPASDYSGGALVALDPDGQEMKLSLRKYHIDVHIEDGFARTTIDQTYFNHRQGRLEGTFYFPLPPDASISRLAMYVNGRLMEGGMAERDHARNVFETIKYKSLDPALLEWVDGSTFKMRVFPLEGRQEKRIVLSYTQRLDDHYGRMQYRFPAGHSMDVVRDWSVKLNIEQSRALQWKCTSHDLKADIQDSRLTLTAFAKNERPDRDVVVELTKSLDAESGEHYRFSTVEHEGSRYLMLRLRPELESAEKRERRDWVFLLDADGSRNPLLARVQVDIVKALLGNAAHDDTFSIITAGTRVRAFAAKQKPVTPKNVAEAHAFLDEMHLIGALDLNKAIVAANAFVRSAKNPTLVHIGGGIPILGERQTSKLTEQLIQTAPYIGVGVGKRWNRQFMKSAASRTGGCFIQINPDEPIRWRALELDSMLNTPRLMNIRVEADVKDAEFLYVKDWVAHGEEFCAVTRITKDQTSAGPIKAVTISGSVDGGTFRRMVPVEEAAGDAEYLPRMWAKLSIESMVAQDAETNKSEIIELSKAMYVMSPFTSLLVLENDDMYEEYNIDRGRKDHWALYPCPQKIEVVHEPLHGPQPPPLAESDAPAPKPSVEAVLRTLLIRRSSGGYSTLAIRQVVVPDGGVALLGGIRSGARLNKNSVPVLDRLPYVNRLFKNGDWNGDATQLMLMLTPRIIIQEEEERIGLDPIVVNHYGNGNGDVDFDALMDLIQLTITPDTWEDVGGPGTVQPFPTNLSLVISQTQNVHGQAFLPEFGNGEGWIEKSLPSDPKSVRSVPEFPHLLTDWNANANLWTELTKTRRRYESQDLAGRSATERQILEKLDVITDFKYEALPLKDVVTDLQRRLDVPIVINREEIDKTIDGTPVEGRNAGVHSPVSMNLSEISLRSGLRLMLAKLGLTYYVSADAIIQITTYENMENQLFARNYDFDETLLLVHRHDVKSPPYLGSVGSDTRAIDQWARILDQRTVAGTTPPNLLYPDLGRDAEHRLVRRPRRLISFAPATTTTRADVWAVLEAEASLENAPQHGKVDKQARALIEGARSAGWSKLKLQTSDHQPGLEVNADGKGRFRFEHRTTKGLLETVVCDGETLRHFYPEIGIGTARKMSRFHRAELTQLIPWLLPTTEDLAVGADLRMIGPRTVAIAPHAIREGQHEDPNGDRPTHLRMHLKFAPDNRLIERRVVEMPSSKTVLRITYTKNGIVEWFDGDHQQLGECSFSVEESTAPDLTPDVEQLVILPMPIRDRGHIFEQVRRANRKAPSGSEAPSATAGPDALQTIAGGEKERSQNPAQWSESDALALLIADHAQNPSELRDVIGRRFFARGDRRIGFYTLLLSSGLRWDVEQPVKLTDSTTTPMNPLADHPKSVLARYFDCQLRTRRFDLEARRDLKDVTPADFILQLAEYQQLAARWSRDDGPPTDAEARRQELNQLFDFVARCDNPTFAFSLLRRLQRRYGDRQPHGRIATALIDIERRGTFSYAVKYELARSLGKRGKKNQSRALFVDVYQEALDAGILPPIDRDFLNAVQSGAAPDPFAAPESPASPDPFGAPDPFNSSTTEPTRFATFMQGACAKLIQSHRVDASAASSDLHERTASALDARPLLLAWQCRQLGKESLGDALVDQMLTGVPENQQSVTTLAALEYWVLAGRLDRAESLLDSLLSNSMHAESPALWRLSARVASDSGRVARSAGHLQRAVDLEYENLPSPYNVEHVRQTYGQLFERYGELARIVAASDTSTPLDLVRRTVQAADRWRSLDTDITAACNAASRVLSELGASDLAWDYLTTPLAIKPNESTAWLNLATTLEADGEIELASKAFGYAFAAEPTNAQILWDHARLLEQAGRYGEARSLYRQIAEGSWQPRFNGLKRQAGRINLRD